MEDKMESTLIKKHWPCLLNPPVTHYPIRGQQDRPTLTLVGEIKVLRYCVVLQRGGAQGYGCATKAPGVTRTFTYGICRAPWSGCIGLHLISYSIVLFSLSLFYFYRLVLWDRCLSIDRVKIALSQLCIPKLFKQLIIIIIIIIMTPQIDDMQCHSQTHTQFKNGHHWQWARPIV